jgi:hypothetical protein
MKTDNSTHEYFIRLKESESRMDTHEVRVSLETAKMLQRVGFDWECEYAILPTTEMGDKAYRYNKGKSHNYNNKEAYSFEIYSAPTLDVAQRWLREVHHLHITIFSSSQESWMFRITKPHQKLEDGVYGEDTYVASGIF